MKQEKFIVKDYETHEIFSFDDEDEYNAFSEDYPKPYDLVPFNDAKILHLTLQREWFDEIAKGEKTEEYREIKPYWTRQLENNVGFVIFDEIYFKNGYAKNAPFMRVIPGRIKKDVRELNGVKQMLYVIELEQVVEIRNYDKNEIVKCPTCDRKPLQHVHQEKGNLHFSYECKNCDWHESI